MKWIKAKIQIPEKLVLALRIVGSFIFFSLMILVGVVGFFNHSDISSFSNPASRLLILALISGIALVELNNHHLLLLQSKGCFNVLRFLAVFLLFSCLVLRVMNFNEFIFQAMIFASFFSALAHSVFVISRLNKFQEQPKGSVP